MLWNVRERFPDTISFSFAASPLSGFISMRMRFMFWVNMMVVSSSPSSGRWSQVDSLTVVGHFLCFFLLGRFFLFLGLRLCHDHLCLSPFFLSLLLSGMSSGWIIVCQCGRYRISLLHCSLVCCRSSTFSFLFHCHFFWNFLYLVFLW